MAFRVERQPQAFADLDSMAVYIKDRNSFATTERWFNAIIKDIASVKEILQPCSVAPESEDLDREIRVLLHGRRSRTYKIYFSISQEPAGIVSVFHVRHWARKPLTNEELEELNDDQHFTSGEQ